ncbi:hypothetical protein F5888DRAFT_898503 [Russula emetica]|nr:hypothetical protein F5888DRAFT_898503 [Russula emetica]
MGAPFPLIDLSLSVMVTVTTTNAQLKRFASSVPQLGSESVFLPFIALLEMIKGDSPRALLYLPRRDNVAVSHHINVSPSFCNLLQPAQVPVNRMQLYYPHPSSQAEVQPHAYC